MNEVLMRVRPHQLAGRVVKDVSVRLFAGSISCEAGRECISC